MNKFISKFWPTKKLGEVAEIYQPETITSKEILKAGPYKVFGANGIIGYYSKFNHENPEVIIGCRGTCGSVYFTEPHSWITGNAMVVRPKIENLLKEFLYYYLQVVNLKKAITGTSQPQITRGTLSPIKIPFPPFKIQQKIVERLDAIKKAQELNGKQIELTEELFQSLLHRELDPKGKDWEQVRVKEVIEKIEYGLSVSIPNLLDDNGVPIVSMADIDLEGNIDYRKARKIKISKKELEKFRLNKNDLLFNWRNSKEYIGKTGLFNQKGDFVFASFLLRVITNNKVLPEFLWLIFNDYRRRGVFIGKARQAVSQSNFNATELGKLIKIPLPSIETQRKIVEKLSAVQEYKKKLLEQKQKLQELFNSVLNKSFKGE